ncbi:MAG: ATP-dependent DNA ligase [Candidatus Dormiibacterota bacterium]
MLDFAHAAGAIAGTTSTLAKRRTLADYLRGLPEPELRRAAIFMTGQPYGRAERRTLQLGWATIGHVVERLSGRSPEELRELYRDHGDVGDWARDALRGRTHPAPATLTQLATALDGIADAQGQAEKERLLTELLDRLDEESVRFLVKVLTYELRIGLQEGLVEAAIAAAFEVPPATVRRVHMVTGDLGETAVRCARHDLDDIRLTLFQPFRFMLATPVEDPEEAFRRMRRERLWTEEKYDGVRCQLHRDAARAALFSRDLRETTDAFPELAEAAAALDRDLVLDGEVLAYRGDRVAPFFDLQRRLGRKQVSAKLRREVPVVLVAFDLLSLDGELLTELPLGERRRRLEALQLRWPFLLARVEEAGTTAELDRIFEETRARGNEGLMVKDPASAYLPGRRGMAWLKVKRPLATLDAVVTTVEWGHGKRHGVLSDYTFAVLDEESGELRNVGKAFTGLTDVEIAEMTAWFLDHTIADYGHARAVEQTVVVEVAFDSIQRSSRHRSGYALRFPRIVRLRPDKPVAEIDTVSRVDELFRHYFDRYPPLAEVAETERA